MNLTRQMTFWVAALVVAALAIWLLRGVLLPFVAGMALAYLLDPVANLLERLGLNRLVATLLIIGVFIVGLLLLLILFAPVIGSQLAAFIQKGPDYVARLQSLVTDPNRPWLRKLSTGITESGSSTGDLVKDAMGWLAAFLSSLWSGGQALISIVSLVIVTPVVALYLLLDWHRMVATVDSWVPLPHRAAVRALAREIDAALAGFVRGQTAVCLILGSYYALTLTFVGLSFGLLIGLVAGLITFVPYLGSMIGLVVCVGIAIAQFWPDYVSILTVLGIFLVGQFVEGYVLSPKLVGESVGLHPVWLMFALFAF
ncbi:MAG TPA: AI-2E family transporter, partial [Xanthobacteraceae bacterium]|nr:AI-2E family transporter [Xanthobacteraceae bacterium]